MQLFQQHIPLFLSSFPRRNLIRRYSEIYKTRIGPSAEAGFESLLWLVGPVVGTPFSHLRRRLAYWVHITGLRRHDLVNLESGWRRLETAGWKDM